MRRRRRRKKGKKEQESQEPLSSSSEGSVGAGTITIKERGDLFTLKYRQGSGTKSFLKNPNRPSTTVEEAFPPFNGLHTEAGAHFEKNIM